MREPSVVHTVPGFMGYVLWVGNKVEACTCILAGVNEATRM